MLGEDSDAGWKMARTVMERKAATRNVKVWETRPRILEARACGGNNSECRSDSSNSGIGLYFSRQGNTMTTLLKASE